jgi:hypothetical protein
MEGKIMTPAECIEMLSNELQDEAARADSYRESCMRLIDAVADDAVTASRKSRKAKFKIINNPINEPPPSDLTN